VEGEDPALVIVTDKMLRELGVEVLVAAGTPLEEAAWGDRVSCPLEPEGGRLPWGDADTWIREGDK